MAAAAESAAAAAAAASSFAHFFSLQTTRKSFRSLRVVCGGVVLWFRFLFASGGRGGRLGVHGGVIITFSSRRTAHGVNTERERERKNSSASPSSGRRRNYRRHGHPRRLASPAAGPAPRNFVNALLQLERIIVSRLISSGFFLD